MPRAQRDARRLPVARANPFPLRVPAEIRSGDALNVSGCAKHTAMIVWRSDAIDQSLIKLAENHVEIGVKFSVSAENRCDIEPGISACAEKRAALPSKISMIAENAVTIV